MGIKFAAVSLVDWTTPHFLNSVADLPFCHSHTHKHSQARAAQAGQSFIRSESVTSLQEFNKGAGIQKQKNLHLEGNILPATFFVQRRCQNVFFDFRSNVVHEASSTDQRELEAAVWHAKYYRPRCHSSLPLRSHKALEDSPRIPRRDPRAEVGCKLPIHNESIGKRIFPDSQTGLLPHLPALTWGWRLT